MLLYVWLFHHVVTIFIFPRGQHDQQLKMKEESLSDLENKIKHLREELQEEREKYQNKVYLVDTSLCHLSHFVEKNYSICVT